jgi:23S rRNA (guanine745-N1)-methyltransferase
VCAGRSICAPAAWSAERRAARRDRRGGAGLLVTLLCTVRGCAGPLALRGPSGPGGGTGLGATADSNGMTGANGTAGESTKGGRALVCPRGHRFDLARSGYCNLLQPQDRRSRQPGDPPAAVAARRRLFDRGLGDWLIPHLMAVFDQLRLPAGAAVLDVGCGEGFHLGTLARLRIIEAHGLDLAAGAIDLAARRHPGATWVVANADRFLPYAGGAFALALSLTSRLNPGELRRVLAPPAAPPAPAAAGGVLLAALPGADDLIELRAAVLGEGLRRDRLPAAIARLAGDFELAGHTTATHRLRLEGDDLRDLLTSTYRGARERQRQEAAALAAMELTLSRDLAWFRPRRRPL